MRVFLHSLALLCTFSGAAPGAETDSVINDIQVGFQQTARVASWTPVTVVISPVEIAFKGHIEVVTPDPSGNRCVVRSEDFSVAIAASREVTVLTMLGRLETSLTVRLVSEGAVVESRRLSTNPGPDRPADFTVLPHSRRFWLVAGNLELRDPSDADANQERLADLVHLTRLDEVSDLPDDWRVLSTCETIVLPAGFAMSDDQMKALVTWLKRGGHVIAAVGRRSGDIDRRSEFVASPLGKLMPQDSRLEAIGISDFSEFESYVARKGAEQQFRVPLMSNSEPGTRLSIPEGRTVVSSLNGDLVVQFPVGFGRMTLIGASLEGGPLSRWRQGELFLTKLTELAPDAGGRAESSNRISRSGITELSTQLRRSLETTDASEDRSALVVLGLILLYLLIIGPVDYYVVHRVLKRPSLTWVTFPAMILLGALLTHAAAVSSNGTESHTTQLDCIDLDVATGFVRQTSWARVYSAENRRFRASLRSNARAIFSSGDSDSAATATAGLIWFGASEQNYGGMYRGGGLELGRAEYRLAPDLQTVNDLPVPVWSSRMLTAESIGQADSGLFTAKLAQSGSGGQLARESTLTHQLSVPVEDWVLFYGTRAYFFQSSDPDAETALLPGVEWSPSQGVVGSQELQSFLSGIYYELTMQNRQVGSQEYVSAQQEYDARSTDLTRIVHMLTLHTIAGGHAYTGLSHDALSHLEMSPAIPLNRAILAGRISEPGSTFEINGEPDASRRRETFIRVVLPVRKNKGNFRLFELNGSDE